MSLKAMSWVFDHSPYTGAPFTVHLTLADSVNDDHDMQFFMRQSKLAAKCRLSRQAVSKAIKTFLEDGLLELVTDNTRSGRDDANVYRFVMPDDQPLAYSNKTRSGLPGDARRESLLARKARDYQLEKARDEHEAANPSLFEEPETFDGYVEVDDDDSPQATVVSMFPTDAEDDNVVDAELIDEGYEDVDAPAVDFTTGKVTNAQLNALTLEAVRELMPDQIIPPEQAGNAAFVAVHYYIRWREETGIGKLQIAKWARDIGSAVKKLVAGNKDHEANGGGPIPPSVALDAVMEWHDRSVAKIRKERKEGKNVEPLHPGAIVSLGRTMYSPDTRTHGVDGQGHSRGEVKDLARHEALDQTIAHLRALGE